MFSSFVLPITAALFFASGRPGQASPIAVTHRCACHQEAAQDVFEKLKVIPDVLADGSKLEFTLGVEYAGGLVVTPGSNVSVAQASQEPAWSIPKSFSSSQKLEGKAYTIFMVDPDAPTPQNRSLGQVVHFIQPDFVLQDCGELLKSERNSTIVPYLGPGPPPGSDPHRYTQVIFEQLGGLGSIKASEAFLAKNFSDINERLKFNLTTFVQELGGESKLKPVGGNVFLTGPADA
ncbi:phosphatidylethanolamine-binding protein [Flagelloscypha sp. PMI_526]|nr:phosphatidylethanolamine-binding protein [Flagelloscypha sp. PMI_526]